MIDGEFYFVLHAPRQSGKTTCLQALTKKINSEGRYYAINCSLEFLRNTNDPSTAMKYVVDLLNSEIEASDMAEISRLAYAFDGKPSMNSTVSMVRYLLRSLCQSLDRELVVFFDEADCIPEDPLVLFLAQIRTGYLARSVSESTKFPRSMALVGMRDISDYLYMVRPEAKSTGLASPFNVKKKSLTLSNFSLEEINSLYSQHTAETGQFFEPTAVERAWYWTDGQPWLVNAIADDVVVRQFKKDYSKVITRKDIDQAAGFLILQKETHFDSLLERLKEPRVRSVIYISGNLLATERSIPEHNINK
ncbi:MAG: ATP-binding protein [Deltaproteobacteria bacterium]|nr:ATP-binding protein [Deltaproteobacteria bacterium]